MKWWLVTLEIELSTNQPIWFRRHLGHGRPMVKHEWTYSTEQVYILLALFRCPTKYPKATGRSANTAILSNLYTLSYGEMRNRASSSRESNPRKASNLLHRWLRRRRAEDDDDDSSSWPYLGLKQFGSLIMYWAFLFKLGFRDTVYLFWKPDPCPTGSTGNGLLLIESNPGFELSS